MPSLTWLDDNQSQFPPTTQALEEPNGLLALGGCLSSERLVSAYRKGIFPWYSDGQPIMWWAPNPRMVLHPQDLYLGRSTKKLLKRNPFLISADSVFDAVIEQCATCARAHEEGTWITSEMRRAYTQLHKYGIAHSIEAWHSGNLVGGLYGIAIGKVFFGESMFSLMSGASKVAFISLTRQLARWGYTLIDCQVHTEYLQSFGAKEVDRKRFESLLKASTTELGNGPIDTDTFKTQHHLWRNTDFNCVNAEPPFKGS